MTPEQLQINLDYTKAQTRLINAQAALLEKELSNK